MIVPVILSGGIGSRLWPLSRRDLAKQLAPVLDGETLFQRTLQRFNDPGIYARPIVISGDEQRFIIKDQAAQIGVEADFVLEPEPRDTLAAIIAAAAFARDRDGDPIVFIAPSDHLTPDLSAFTSAVELAARAAEEAKIVTFGLKPSRPATGYGYIRAGKPLAPLVREISEFVEKPDADRAASLISEGCLWNAGMFCFRASTVLSEASARRPEVSAAVEAALKSSVVDLGSVRLGPEFKTVQKVSFDVSIMETTDKAAVAEVDFPWSDVGDWRELWAVSDQDDMGNAALGDVVLQDCEKVFVRGGDRLICALGLDDIVIVDTPDAVLVADRDHAQDVKKLVTQLTDAARPEATTHARVYRPWGWYQSVDRGERFKVKRINVTPGRKLSLQRHHHRAEHWVVVKGTAEVTIDDTVTLLRENESIYIPMGATHRLANPGRIPVEIIEVQTGGYLEEDDIVRIEDDFGRKGS